ncbi:MAG TPA: protein phosphatase 2C domain-containing protein [Trichormus sp.]|jgi:protein phosphatase
MSKLVWSVASKTDVGLKRSENQDNFFVSDDNRLFVVADGMGGVMGGAEASRLAVEAIKRLWAEDQPPLDDELKAQAWLHDAVRTSNESVCDAADQIIAESRMGTTIVAALQGAGNQLHIAHVGDSRAYLLRDGALDTLTNDHSMVFEMMQLGQLTWQQCQESPWRSILTRCIGHERDVLIDTKTIEPSNEDWVVLCTDGLCGYVTDEKIMETIKACETAEQACSELVSCSMEVGAPDNVTVVVVQYRGETAAEKAKRKAGAAQAGKQVPKGKPRLLKFSAS